MRRRICARWRGIRHELGTFEVEEWGQSTWFIVVLVVVITLLVLAVFFGWKP